MGYFFAFEMTDKELKEQRKQGKVFAIICVKEIVTELNKLPSKDMSDLQFWGEVDYELSLLYLTHCVWCVVALN